MDIQHTARLAKLEIPEDSAEKWQKDMESIIEMVGKLPEIDEDELLLHDEIMPMHDDILLEPLISRDEMLSNAPAAKNGYICVPKTVTDKEHSK